MNYAEFCYFFFWLCVAVLGINYGFSSGVFKIVSVQSSRDIVNSESVAVEILMSALCILAHLVIF